MVYKILSCTFVFMKGITISLLATLLLSVFVSCGSEQTKTDSSQGKASKPEATGQGMPDQVPSIDIAPLLEAGLNGDIGPIEQAIEKGFDVNTTDAEMHTILMLAAYNGHSEIVSLALEHGAKPDMKDLQDRTALMYASTGPFNETVTLLLDAGASANLVDNVEHFTALMFAAAEGQVDVVKTLLDHGADKSLVDIDSESAYDFALANGHAQVASLLK